MTKKETQPNIAARKVLIEKITINPRTDEAQIRHHLDPDTVANYAELKQDGVEFPPIVLFFDGTFCWVGDGFHRLAAEIRLGYKDTMAIVHNGGFRDAILHGAKANGSHGLPLNRKDKRALVEKVLDNPDFQGMSTREIAAAIGVSHTYIAERQKERIERQEGGEEKSKKERLVLNKEPMALTDSEGNDIPEKLQPVFWKKQTIVGRFNAIFEALNALSEIAQDAAKTETMPALKLSSEIAEGVKALRELTRKVESDCIPYSVFGAESESLLPYYTAADFKDSEGRIGLHKDPPLIGAIEEAIAESEQPESQKKSRFAA